MEVEIRHTIIQALSSGPTFPPPSESTEVRIPGENYPKNKKQKWEQSRRSHDAAATNRRQPSRFHPIDVLTPAAKALVATAGKSTRGWGKAARERGGI